MRRQQNAYKVPGGAKDSELSETNQPLLPKGARLAAVKMVKGELKLFIFLQVSAKALCVHFL